jgi:CotH kinase protein
VERFAAFAAVEVLTGHHDGYTMDRNNYRIYNDPASGQLVFLPHDLDKLFTKADEPILPEWKGLVAKSVFGLPAGQKLYLKQLAALMGGAFKPEATQRVIGELVAIIRPALATGDEKSLKAFDDAVAQLRKTITARQEFIAQQLKSVAVKE